MTKPELLCEDTWAIEDAGVRIFILKGKDKTIVIDIRENREAVTWTIQTE